MLKTLAFSQVSHMLTAPSIDGGLPQGLVIQLWIRRTTGGEGGSRQPIVALTGSDSKVVLGSGDRPDVLMLTVTTPERTYELGAPGAMPADRWAQVRAVLRPSGTATLSVLGMTVASNFVGTVGTTPLKLTIGGGSFTGDLSQLQIWTHAAPAKLSYAPPPLDAADLWAYYPLEALKQGPNSKSFVTPDAGPNRRDAVGAVEQTVRWHDEAQADGGGSFLRFAGPAAEARLSPISCLSGQLAMEAWIRDESDDARPAAVIQLLGARGQAALIAGGKDGQVALVVIPDGVTIEVCSAKGLIKKNEWSHVAATVGFDAPKGTIVARVFHQGVQVAAAELSALTDQQGPPKFAPLHALLHEALVTRCMLGGAVPGGARFRGGMAEARIWQKSAPERVGTMWLARVHGGEPSLLAAYRMANVTATVFDDISARRGRGTVAGEVAMVPSGGPPIASLRVERAFRLTGRAKLVREWLPAELAGSQATGKAGAQRSVFDATLEVQARDGGVPTDRKLEVRVDRAMTALVDTDGVVKPTAWAAATSYLLAIPNSGQIRVRMLADSLSCPTLRVRVAGAPGGLWTILRPDQTAQSRLGTLTARSLQSPGEGRTSPMPAGSTTADAEALAVALRQLATQCPRRPQAVTDKQKKWVLQTFGLGDIGDAFDDIGDAAEDLGEVIVDTAEDAGDAIVDTAENAGDAIVDTAEDAGQAVAGAAVDVSNAVVGAAETVVKGAKRTTKSAAGLLKQSAAEVDALRVKANKTAARVGQAAISTLIDSADSLAIFVDETVEAAHGWVEVIGTSIVNGVEVAWRAVVSGVEDALTAVTALLKRIGAEIQKFLDYLAYLFAWGDFLAESDKLYATLEQSIEGLGGMLQQVGSYKDDLGATLRSTVKKAVGDRTVGDLFGLKIERTNPAIEHLDYFLEQVQRAIESVDAVFEGVAEVATGDTAPSQALIGSAEANAARLPMSSLANPLTLLTTPVKDLLAGNGGLADGSSSLLDAAFSEIVGSGSQALTTGADQVRARIKVPWLTDMIESVILGGRSFTLLRAAALAGAIPSVLTSKLSSGQKKKTGEGEGSITGITGPSPQQTPTKSPQEKQAAERFRRALWASTGLGLINSGVVVAKTVLEMRKVKKGIGILTVSSGICICMRGYCTSQMLTRYASGAQPFAKANVWFDVIEGVYTVLSGLRKAESDAKWAKFDMAFHGILGLAITTSSAVALGTGKLGGAQARAGFALRCASWVGNSMVRLAEKSDDVSTSPTAKKCTLGLAAIVAVVEVAEAVNGNVDDVQSTE